VGGFLAGALARDGRPVTLILRAETLAAYPAKIRVSSRVLGDFEAPVTLATELNQPVDALWITVKATQLHAAISATPANRIGDALVVPLMNGVDHMTLLRSRYDPEHVVGGTIRVESERVAPGRIRQVSPFAAVRLAATGPAVPRVDELAGELRSAGLDCEVVEDETSLLWGKLVFLAPLALTTSAQGEPLGGVRAAPEWRVRLEACLDEACAVAEVVGARLDRTAILHLLLAAPDEMRSSMQKDIAAGREPELDAIGGPIVRFGRAHGLNVSTTEELMEMIAAARS